MDSNQEIALNECAERLGEMFDSVLILVCHKGVSDGGKMMMETRMRGNDYAAVGMGHTFIEMQQGDKVGEAVKEALDG